MAWRIPGPITFPQMHVDAPMAAAHRGSDPLSLRELPSVEAAHAALLKALRGVPRIIATRIASSMTSDGTESFDGVDELTARLMASAGIDPLVLAWLSRVNGCSIIVTNRKGERVASMPPWLGYPSATGVMIGPGIQWFTKERTILHELTVPDTMLLAMSGRALRDIVSHPILDQYPFVIDRAENRSIHVRRLFDLRIEPRITWATLASTGDVGQRRPVEHLEVSLPCVSPPLGVAARVGAGPHLPR